MPDKTVAEKLMIKPGRRVLLVNAPVDVESLLGPLPLGAVLVSEPGGQAHVIVVFTTSRAELETRLPPLKHLVAPGGMIWVTYYKGASKHKTDINRDTINAYAKSLGMEGVAILSVNEDWSALRLKVVAS